MRFVFEFTAGSMQRKEKKGGNAAIRNSAGPMAPKEERRANQKVWAEIDRQLAELGVSRINHERARAKEGR
jgi:hypothetical protein